jgi:hypothetical protein
VYPWRASADSAASTTRLRSLFGEPELIDSPFVESLLSGDARCGRAL